MSDLKRRNFLKKTALATAAGTTGLLSACGEKAKKKVQTPYINFNKKFEWKLATTWPPNFPILGEGCNLFADWVEQMSGGRMSIRVYGGGELIPSLECFGAVSHGAIEMFHGSPYYWSGKIPVAQMFATVPFGMSARQASTWIRSGGGMELWKQVYEPFNLLPFIAGSTGLQMGGWYNREINSVEDLQGLKMRMPGLGGKVLGKAGGAAVLMAGGEIFTNLERGVIDATEWIGPYHDFLMGFHEVAKYYYYPGWHEPGTMLEMTMNKDKYAALPSDLKEILAIATYKLDVWMIEEFEKKNAEYLSKIKVETKAELRRFSPEVLSVLKGYTKEVLAELVTEDKLAQEIYIAYELFRKRQKTWEALSVV